MTRRWSVGAVCTLLVVVLSGLADSPRKAGSPEGNARQAAAAEPSPVFVNSKRVRINYEVRKVGPSGIGAIDLWYTRDGQDWKDINRIEDAEMPFVFDAPEDGRYGFTVVVRGGAGRPGRAPHVGDAPQKWVEVDSTPPRVLVYPPEVGTGRDVGKVTLKWSATDRNMTDRPVSLFYAEKPARGWHVIAENVENTGRYVWELPPGVPFRVYLRVVATDLAGNRTVAESLPFVIDAAEPEAVITGVAPAVEAP